MKKKHIFKKRRLYYNLRSYDFKIGTSGLLSLRPQRFEMVYMRGFKKLIRRRHIRRKMRFSKRKFWFFIKPNCILSGKSTNSRMGAGVGSLIRLTVNLKAYKTFVEFLGYSPVWITKLYKRSRFRYPIRYMPIYK